MTVKELKGQLNRFPDDCEIKYAPQGNLYGSVSIVLTPAPKRYGDNCVYMNILENDKNNN